MDATIELVDVVETQYGEKAALQTPPPWESETDKEEHLNAYIKFLPWAEDEGPDVSVFDDTPLDPPSYDFPDDYASHWEFSDTVLGEDEAAWIIDVDAVEEFGKMLKEENIRLRVDDDVNPEIV